MVPGCRAAHLGGTPSVAGSFSLCKEGSSVISGYGWFCVSAAFRCSVWTEGAVGFCLFVWSFVCLVCAGDAFWPRFALSVLSMTDFPPSLFQKGLEVFL